MADIDASIHNIQQGFAQLLERVSKGEVLSREEILVLHGCRQAYDQVKQIDTYKEVQRGTKLMQVCDKWAPDTTPVKPKLPDCYNTRVYFEPKGEERTYIKHFGDGKDNSPMLVYTKDVNEAKLFRSHVGWMGPGRDHDSYHNMMDFLRTFFTMDKHQYRTATGSECLDDEANTTEFVAESLEGQPRLTFLLFKL